MSEQSTDNQEGCGCHDIATRALECKVQLLQSEVEALTRISRWRAQLESQAMEQLRTAEESMTSELRRVVTQQEMDIDMIEKQARTRESQDDSYSDETHQNFQNLVVRFEPDESFNLFRDNVFRFGRVHLEEITEAQMYGAAGTLDTSAEAGHYTEINSDSLSSVQNYISPVYDIHYEDIEKPEQKESTQDETQQAESEPIGFASSMTRYPSIDTLQLFEGDSMLSDNEHITEAGALVVKEVTDLSQDTAGWKTFHLTERQTLHTLVIRKKESLYSTPTRKLTNLEKFATSGRKEDNDHSLHNATSKQEQSEESPELYATDMDSCLVVIISDGRLVVLCESIETLLLFDTHYTYKASLKLNQPKVICFALEDLVLVVHVDGVNENVLLIEANTRCMNIKGDKQFSCHGRIFDIKYRDSKIFLGCNDGHLHIWNVEFEELSVVNIDTVSFPCISMDYDPESDTLFVVSSNGGVTSIVGIEAEKSMYDSIAMQGTVVFSLSNKAYALCSKDKYKVVNEICLDEGRMKLREVIRLTESNSIDMVIAPDGDYLLLLQSDGSTLYTDRYSIQCHK